jgi:hypothetical protein
MNRLRFLCILVLLAAISCQPLAKPETVPSPNDSTAKAVNGKITVIVDGREATPEEQEVFGALGKHLLSEAVARTVNEAQEQAFKKLDIIDPVETALFGASCGTRTFNGNELLSIHVIRPGKEGNEPQTIVLYRDGKSFVRFTRSSAAVARPVAVMTVTSLKDGRFDQEEWLLVYGSDDKWKQYHAHERAENMTDGKK